MKKFDLQNLKQGYILHARTSTLIGRLIRRVINKRANPKCWGNHDAIIVMCEDGHYRIGESIWPRAALTDLRVYEQDIDSGLTEIKILKVADATDVELKLAAIYWKENVYHTWYDWAAFPRLAIKAVLFDFIDSKCGWEWARWCTEGVAESFAKGAGRDIFAKKNPTPYTTEKRLASGILVDITEMVFK